MISFITFFSHNVNFRPGYKSDYNCLKIMNASGPGQSRGRGSGGEHPPEDEAFLSPPVAKTQSPGTLALNHVYLLYSNNINIPKTDQRFLKKWVGPDNELYVRNMIMSN